MNRAQRRLDQELMAKVAAAHCDGPVDLTAVLDEFIAELEAQGQLDRWRQQVLADCSDAAAAGLVPGTHASQGGPRRSTPPVGIVKLSEVGAVANHISLMRHI